MAFDSTSAYEEALASWPMPRVLAHYSMGQFLPPKHGGNYKKEPCPFCGRKGKFSAFTKKVDGKWLVKCQIDRPTPCEANKAMDEIGLIQRMENLPDRKAAYMRFLELAGVVIEKAPAPVVQPAPQAAPESEPVAQPPPQPPLETLFQPQPEAQPEPEPANVVPFLQGSSTGAKPPPPTPPKGPDTKDIWATLHPLLLLTNADRERLKTKRGFSDQTIDTLGFKSSNAANIEIINSLRDKFPPHQLLDSGLFVKTPAGGMAPFNQFTGWGITGKKDAKGKAEWGATNPVLIPYRDANGTVTSIRPHKGGIPKRDKDDDEFCGGDIYCPLLIETRLENFDHGSPLYRTLVLTESEFKAAAIWQAGFPAIGIPGTSFVRNPIFRARLVSILERFGIQRVIVVFDNEIKDKPGMPSYKADPFDRYWHVIWARYIAWDLIKRSPRPAMLDEVQIGNLRDEWRLDDNGVDTGKVDWDTALAMFVRKEGVIHGTARASQEFEKVLLEAQAPNDFLDLFPDVAQTIIGTRLENLWHTPLLKSGGDVQEKLARRLDRIGKLSTIAMQIMAQKMTAALRSVIGTYYVLKVTPDKVKVSYTKSRAALSSNIADLQNRRGEKTAAGMESIEAMIARMTLERRLLTELIEEGTPEAISNFTAKCEYCRHTADHKTERLIRIENTQGEKTSLLPLPAESNGRLAEFRVWCLERTQGVAVWRGGEKDLQNLTEDMKHLSAHRNIFEIPHYGFDPNSKITFFGDCAWAPDGEVLLPDANNIFWHGGMGYQVDIDAALVGEGFQQGAPLLAERPGDDKIDIKLLFQRFSEGIFDTVGDYDGLLCVGMSLLYAAAQQVYRDYGGMPGLWLYGKRGGGKTTVARWLMRIWGFKELQGIRLDKTTTAVGMTRNLTQYSDIPLWFDEYRRNIPDIDLKEAVLRGAFDRSSGSKGRMDSTTKTNTVRALTTPIVSGEMSSPDAATRSRYVHALIATSRRRRQGEGNVTLFRTMMADSNHLHLIGRYLMNNRRDFNENLASHLSIWMKSQLGIPDDRTRFVHGAAYAAFTALAEMLNISNVDLNAFANYTVKHANLAFDDVHDETMVNKFWTDVISAINRGNIDRRLFDEKSIVLSPKGAYDPALVELSGAPRIESVFLAPNEVFDMYALDLRRRGDAAPLSKNDIQREISKEEYWIEPAGTQRIHRATLNGHRYNGVWVINLEKFPFAEQLKDALDENGTTAGT
jgi:hypothetical protein